MHLAIFIAVFEHQPLLFTGIAISSNCMRVQFLFQRHRPIVKNPRTKGCYVFLGTFQQKSYS